MVSEYVYINIGILNKIAVLRNKVLFLSLKKVWYDKIDSGEKLVEYREIKEFWSKRLENKKYEYVCFSLGYTRQKMWFKILDIKKGVGLPEWGAEPGKEYYKIYLGNRIK